MRGSARMNPKSASAFPILRFRIYYPSIMFCPSCGIEYTIELKYCNRCGANLGGSLAPQPQPVVVNVTKPTLLIGALLLIVTLGGFGGLVGGAAGLAPFLKSNDPLIAIIMFGMLTILVVDIFLVRLLSKIITAALSPATRTPPSPTQFAPDNIARPLQSPSTARLHAAPSVTENTTRFFDPYRAPAEIERSPAEKLKP